MKRKGFIMGSFALVLVGCATTTIEKSEDKKCITVNETSAIHLVNPWPKGHGVYLQKVKATIQGKPFVFSVHITLEEEKFEARAFNDICGQLYNLTWTPQGTSWESSAYIPEILQPDHIIADFLLAYLPSDQLEIALKGAHVRQTGNEVDNVCVIISDGKEIRRIQRHKSCGDLWERVNLQNLEYGYALDIQTVPLL